MSLSLEQAIQQVLSTVAPLPAQKDPLLDVVGRAVADDLIADHALPAFDNSAMDGFAFCYADISGTDTLRVSDYIPAGKMPGSELDPASACKIMTGAPLPKGADTVVPIENCREQDGRVTIIKAVKAGANVRHQGEDVLPGQKVMSAGTVLGPAQVNLLAALRMSTLPVHRRARVAILATGDELQELEEPYFNGGVVNSNTWGLAAALKEIHAIPLLLGIARDNKDSLKEKILQGLKADALITSAGVSAGDRDLVREVLVECGVKEQFWQIKVRPGKPTAFGLANQTPVFSLPGNPVATMLLFEVLVRPALLKMMGHKQLFRTALKARLTAPISKKSGQVQIIRLTLSINAHGELCATGAGDQRTGILSTLAATQGLTILPEDKDFFDCGEQIDVQILGPGTALS